MRDVTAELKTLKNAAHSLSTLDEDRRNAVLVTLAEMLVKDAPAILAENEKDLAEMPKEDPRHDRLLLSEKRIGFIAEDVRMVAQLPSPLGRTLAETTRPNGLKIERVSVPLGVIGVIYESRPNVTIDVFALCFKAGNACALKGGKEARHSNEALASVIRKSLKQHNVSPDVVCLLPAEREATQTLLEASGLVDVCIPRGSQALIDHVRENAKIPVIETGAGIVHTYFDKSGDKEKGRAIIFNGKTRRVSVCNALDTLVIHKDRLEDLPYLAERLAEKDVEIFADEAAYKTLSGHYPEKLLHKAKDEDFGREFLSYKMSLKTVASFEDALAHIRKYSSQHSEAIVAEDAKTAERFLREVDAAAVYSNAPTSFSDGAQFGLGAEIGISTQKLHARGPMALEALTSYKWVVRGEGQIRE